MYEFKDVLSQNNLYKLITYIIYVNYIAMKLIYDHLITILKA